MHAHMKKKKNPSSCSKGRWWRRTQKVKKICCVSKPLPRQRFCLLLPSVFVFTCLTNPTLILTLNKVGPFFWSFSCFWNKPYTHARTHTRMLIWMVMPCNVIALLLEEMDAESALCFSVCVCVFPPSSVDRLGSLQLEQQSVCLSVSGLCVCVCLLETLEHKVKVSVLGCAGMCFSCTCHARRLYITPTSPCVRVLLSLMSSRHFPAPVSASH